MGAVLTEMSKRGITWDQIVPASKGGNTKTAGALVSDEAQVLDTSATAAEVPKDVVREQEMTDAMPTSKGEALCTRWPLDILIQAVRAKLPAHTSITISN